MQSLLQIRRIKLGVRHQVKIAKIALANNDSSPHLSPTASPKEEVEKILSDEKKNDGTDLEQGSPSSISHNDDKTSRDTLSDYLAEHIPGISVHERDASGHPTKFLVEGVHGDRRNPRHWPNNMRWLATLLVFWLTFVCGWASAVNSSSIKPAASTFHVSKEAESLATALFLFGNALGALPSGPISETAGRNPSYLFFMFLYMVMVMVTALAPNFTVQIVFRFLAGLCASPILTIYGGSLADMFTNAERSIVWPIFALSPILGMSLVSKDYTISDFLRSHNSTHRKRLDCPKPRLAMGRLGDANNIRLHLHTRAPPPSRDLLLHNCGMEICRAPERDRR